jgi:hypothetical protein
LPVSADEGGGEGVDAALTESDLESTDNKGHVRVVGVGACKGISYHSSDHRVLRGADRWRFPILGFVMVMG